MNPDMEQQVDRVRKLLRDKLREQGFSQLDVQIARGWGRSYISQLLTSQKNIRYDQILEILHTIGIAPGDFFAELFPPDPKTTTQEIRRLEQLLLFKSIITDDELSFIRGLPPDQRK